MSTDGQVQKLDYFLFKMTTRKGEFWVEVAEHTEERAELAIWKVFKGLNLPYQRMEPRKNMRGTSEQHMYLDYNGTIMAGEQIWRATGRGVEFEAVRIAMEAEFKAEREEYERRRGN